jgi:hypothetical protein
MRIQVSGTCLSACAVRSGLAAEGFAVTSAFPSYQILIEETYGPVPEVDGVDCELERQIVNMIAKTAGTDILLRRPGGVQSDQKIRILIPKDDAIANLVEQAIIKGFALATQSKSNWRSKWFARF